MIILGVGRPFRGEHPSALVKTSGNHRVIDWTMDAFNGVLDAEYHFVGGYCLDEVLRSYPNLYFSVNPNWRSSGSIDSLFAAPLSPEQTTYVCYADVVFSEKVVRLLHEEDQDVIIVVDRAWRHRYQSRSQKDLESAEKVYIVNGEVRFVVTDLQVKKASAEFVGLMKLAPRTIKKILSIRETGCNDLVQRSIPSLINKLLESGLNVRAIEIEGDWAELNAPQDLARFVLGTKAETLKKLQSLVKQSVIDDQVIFTVGEWHTARDKALTLICGKFGSKTLVVRSSALTEDNWSASKAGVYTSLLNIPGSETGRIAKAVEKVIRSYNDDNPSHQVLVQPMLSGTQMSGVVFTRTLNHAVPYYTINYNDTTSDTQSVTSGNGENLKTVIVYRGLKHLQEAIDPRVSHVIKSIRELEESVDHDSLDFEFAITPDGIVHILQLRPITIDQRCGYISDSLIEKSLQTAKNMFRQRQEPGLFVVGRRTFFGVMPDWNPAEIIGTKPRRLALTLYQYLFTDETWAEQRTQYGYRDVRPHPLMVSFGGHPYVDIRASFNSFIPAKIPDSLAERLVEHYLDHLESHPYLHDKVEFDIVFSCFVFDYEKQAERLLQDKFDQKDADVLREALLEITRGAMERWPKDLDQINILQQRFDRLQEKEVEPLDRAYILLEDCRRYGALPFAHLARAGFIAISLLKSLEKTGVTTPEQTVSFLNSLHTIASMLQQDGNEVADSKMEWDKFVSIYGHLLPGTYEITSPSYKEEPDRYLKPIVRACRDENHTNEENNIWDEKTSLEIADKLRDEGLPDNVQEFENFLRRVIEGREYAKFIFTRNLSVALDSFIQFGAQHHVSREQLSYLSLRDLLNIRTGKPMADIGHWLVAQAEEEQKSYLMSQAMELPPLLLRENDLIAFERPSSQLNYITRSRVVAKIVDLSKESLSILDTAKEYLHGKIVLIPQADPGFDCLFGHNIVVTMYGGANSHMSIRAAEFGVPSAIGVGGSLYN